MEVQRIVDSEPSLGEQNGAVEEIFASVMAAAEGGDAAAQQQLGVLYHRGACDGGPDHEAAAAWFSRAAEAGLASAQCNLGLLHLLGHGVPADDRLVRAPASPLSVCALSRHFARALSRDERSPLRL